MHLLRGVQSMLFTDICVMFTYFICSSCHSFLNIMDEPLMIILIRDHAGFIYLKKVHMTNFMLMEYDLVHLFHYSLFPSPFLRN
jgi:hypothetical protein